MTTDPFADGVIVSMTGEAFVTECRTADHVIVSDEPGSLGGTDTGPSPVKMFLMSLGACKAMTMRMYAQRKDWPLEGVTVALRWEDRRKDGADSGPKIPHVDLEMQIHGDGLDEKQRQRLLEIADKCPVSKCVEGDSVVSTSLVGAE